METSAYTGAALLKCSSACPLPSVMHCTGSRLQVCMGGFLAVTAKNAWFALGKGTLWGDGEQGENTGHRKCLSVGTRTLSRVARKELSEKFEPSLCTLQATLQGEGEEGCCMRTQHSGDCTRLQCPRVSISSHGLWRYSTTSTAHPSNPSGMRGAEGFHLVTGLPACALIRLGPPTRRFCSSAQCAVL